MTDTADPKSAMMHARAMGRRTVDAMPILPVDPSRDIPLDIDAQSLLSDETIAAGGYVARRIARGSRLRFIDKHGDGCLSLLAFNAENPAERLNIADTVKVQWNGYPAAQSVLLSDLGRVLATIIHDDAGTHDSFCGPSNVASHLRKSQDGRNWSDRPAARERLLMGCARFGLGRRDVHPCINLFKPVRIAQDGATLLDVGPFPAGRAVTIRAEMHLIVVAANCPHVLDPRPTYSVTPVRMLTWCGDPAASDDPCRNSTPERLRAFLNTEDYFQR